MHDTYVHLVLFDSSTRINSIRDKKVNAEPELRRRSVRGQRSMRGKKVNAWAWESATVRAGVGMAEYSM